MDILSRLVRRLSSLALLASRRKRVIATCRALALRLSSPAGLQSSSGPSTTRPETATTSEDVPLVGSPEDAFPGGTWKEAEEWSGRKMGVLRQETSNWLETGDVWPESPIVSDLEVGRDVAGDWAARGGHPAGTDRNRSVSKRHLRLVQPDERLVVKEVALCQGTCHVYDGPDGQPLLRGGFDLLCDRELEHDGYCADVTGIRFVPAQALNIPVGARERRGGVIEWNEYTAADVRELEELLTDGVP
jgi:hypothetical protein